MRNEDAIKWLENLKQDIGQLRHENLWPYAQAIDEIIDMLDEHEETIVHCNNENNAKVIARILDMDEAGHFITEESIWGKDGLNEKGYEEEK